MKPTQLRVPATAANFDEAAYLEENADVATAVKNGYFKSGREHFERFGHAEPRFCRLRTASGVIQPVRREKFARLKPHLRKDMPSIECDGRPDFLTQKLRDETKIVDTERVSSLQYEQPVIDMIRRYPNGLLLDCGAGRRDEYWPNVVNYEIVAYDTTDVLGVGEALPFLDNTFDAVISIAVLEHVRDPFTCAKELCRVLKPGGEIFCSMPFLQPYHGYPHHYFNATAQGIRRLFEEKIEVDDVFVTPASHPIWALQWILMEWANGLDTETRAAFEAKTVRDLLAYPKANSQQPFCLKLPQAKQLELAYYTNLKGRKTV